MLENVQESNQSADQYQYYLRQRHCELQNATDGISIDFFHFPCSKFYYVPLYTCFYTYTRLIILMLVTSG